MKKYTILFGAVCAVILAFSQNARANPFTSTLNVSNLAGLETGDFGTVTVLTLFGQTATIHFKAASGFFFVDGSSAAVELNTDSFTEAFVTESPSNNFKAFAFDQQVDGWGKFDLAVDQKSSSVHLTSIFFTVTNTDGAHPWAHPADVLALNANGFDAAAHIFATSTGKTGFAAEGHGIHVVPDGGAAAALLGLGLAGLAGIRARFGRN